MSPDTAAAAYQYFANYVRAQASPLDPKDVTRRVEAAFLDLCRRLAPTISLELGAHEASFSKQMKQDLPDTRCLAFEANPYVVEKFADDVTAAGVEYVAKALASTNGTVELTIPTFVWKKPRRLANKMASLGHHRYTKDSQVVEVESVRLDDFLTLTPEDRVVAWIDVEGASGIVLSSSREVLARASLVYIEVESELVWDEQWIDVDVARFFHELGFVPILRDVQRSHQYNVVFASAELAADPEVAELAAAALRS